MASQTPAGYFRKKWGFFHLPSFNSSEWQEFKSYWDHKKRPIESQKIIGADSDSQAIRNCREHLQKTGFEKEVLLLNSPIAKLSVPRSPTLVVSDPPFGKRMHASTQVYQEFGQFLRSRCPAAPWAYLLTSTFHLIKATGCQVLSEWPLHHGGLNVSLYQIKN